MKHSVDLNHLNIEELQKITENAKKLIEKKRHESLIEAYQKFENIAEKLETDIATILQAGEALERIRSIKYRDPSDEENVWTGRGRKPTWLTTALDNGKTLDDFAV